LFGVPQFRERFWAVLIRKDLADPHMTWQLNPHIVTVGAALDPLMPGTQLKAPWGTTNKFLRKLSTGPCICGDVHNFDVDELKAVGLSSLEGFKRRGFSVRIQPRFFPNEDAKSVCRRHVSPFTSAQPSVLAPGGYTPVLLGSSLWFYGGAPVSKEGYCAIMGFPPDYIFPEDHHYGVRTFLSKGVCPPVATWVLDNIRIHLGLPSGSRFTRGVGYSKGVAHGHIASFRPGRMNIINRLEEMYKAGTPDDTELIPLRDEEEALEDD
jgi:hypothetical protein